jgi:hypothetical protein
MTLADVLAFARDTGIVLTADGDRLRVDAPAGAMTPELRGALVQHKPALLVVLQPMQFISLHGGLVLPEPAFRLVLDLEARGITLTTDPDHQFIIPNDPRLTEADRAAIARWRHHLGAAVEYHAPEIA